MLSPNSSTSTRQIRSSSEWDSATTSRCLARCAGRVAANRFLGCQSLGRLSDAFLGLAQSVFQSPKLAQVHAQGRDGALNAGLQSCLHDAELFPSGIGSQVW